MQISKLFHSNRSAKTESAPSQKALDKRATGAPNLLPTNPPAKFSALKSAKSGGGKSTSSPSILSRLPFLSGKSLLRREASVATRSNGASTSSIPSSRLVSKADNLSAAGRRPTLPEASEELAHQPAAGSSSSQPKPLPVAGEAERQPQAWGERAVPKAMHTAEGVERQAQSLMGSARLPSGAVDAGRPASARLSAGQNADIDAHLAFVGRPGFGGLVQGLSEVAGVPAPSVRGGAQASQPSPATNAGAGAKPVTMSADWDEMEAELAALVNGLGDA